MSVLETRNMIELIGNLPDTMTLVLVEHDMDVVFKLANRITVLHNGKIISKGTPSEIRKNPKVQSKYLFLWKRCNKLASYRIARLSIGLLHQGPCVFPTLTVLENIVIGSQNMYDQQWNMDSILELFPALASRLNYRGWQISEGEQQMIGIAQALMTNPKMLILDEPSEGLAPLLLMKIGNMIKLIRELGLSVMLVEQNVSFALLLADKAYVMNKGRIIFEGHPNSSNENTSILQHYLRV